jgi:hypothetical protein
MIIITLALSFLLSFLPLVIGTLCFRYQPNLFSRGILTLSAASFLLGLGQFALLLGTSYKLFEPAQMRQAYLGIQYVSIAGGIVMIIAGFLWVGYFRTLMTLRAPAKKTVKATSKTAPLAEPSRATANATSVLREEEPAPAAKAPRKRREKPASDDWFADEIPHTRTVRMAAKVTRKKAAKKPNPSND